MRDRRIAVYAGVDPTAPSLHLGHLLAFMPLFWMFLHGYSAFTVIGSSTAKIGDPTGRTTSRPKLSSAVLVQNLATINQQLKALWGRVADTGQSRGYSREWAWKRGIINNGMWWNKQSMLEVFQRLGSHTRVGPLLGRDNVKKRLKDGSGMSLAEFCYPIMQAWDWCKLLEQLGVQMQIGGSDQYGNILTGAQCVKTYVENDPDPQSKLPSGKLYQPIGFTVPLLTDSSGAKFGKSEGNAIWLDPFMTSPYDLYGYLVRRSDEETGKLLKLLTFLPLSEIDKVMAEHMQDPPKRVAQHLLAIEVSRLVHGSALANETQVQHRSVYGKNTMPAPTTGPAAQKLEDYEEKGPASRRSQPRAHMKLPRKLLNGSLTRLVWAAGLATSATDADRHIKGGGIYVGGSPGQYGPAQTGMKPVQLSFVPAKHWEPEANKKFLVDDKLLLLRKGKHNLRVIEFISNKKFDDLGLTYHGQPRSGSFRQAVRVLLDSKQTVTQAKEGGDKTAKVDLAQFNESVLRTTRFRAQTKQLKEDGLLDDDDW